MREKKKNKKNDKKKGKVRIIAGVMTREQDSDYSLSPGGGDKRQKCLPLNNPTSGGIQGTIHVVNIFQKQLEPTNIDFRLRTASGALMPGMGFLMCNMQIGNEYYRQQFIVCKQLTPGIILG